MMTRDYAAPDWRGLCQRMADELDLHRQLLADDRREAHPLAVEARAALAAEPVGEGPKDEEVEAWADDQGFIRGHGDHPCGFWIDDGDAGALARAVLARWGHQPAPLAVGEGPTADELWDIGERHLWTGTDESATNYRILTSFIEAARAVLARYGHQPAPPAATSSGEKNEH